jgi:two-component system KDP operon response regulator KdpE
MSRVLVVDDEPQLLRAMAINLRARGYEVDLAPTGENALQLAAKRHPDVVVLDLGLPGIDGIEVIRGLRGWSKVPIVVLSARDAEGAKVAALDAGADDYVTKPFGPKELRARIAALLRRTRTPENASTVRVGESEIDFHRGEVRRDGQAVPLTPLEFKLLQVFVRAKGRILTREQLIADAWGPGTFVSDRVVDNHIGSLRKKLEPDATEPRYLQNVRGLGYRFDA